MYRIFVVLGPAIHECIKVDGQVLTQEKIVFGAFERLVHGSLTVSGNSSKRQAIPTGRKADSFTACLVPHFKMKALEGA
jgi:uncharacterized protein (DUF1810 family)